MKNLIISCSLFLLVFGACKTSQVSSFSDDLYARPSEERRLARIAAEEKAKKEAEEKQKTEEAAAARKAKDDANPYYQDPQYSQDDYYDYQYASRLRRFYNPIYGAGYYDNFYTNSYMYNQNPACYGTSIYSTYNWMPSNQFLGYNSGWGMGYGFNSFAPGNCWNAGFGYPYSYNNGFFNGYMMGLYSGYNGFAYHPNYFGYHPYGFGNGFGSGIWGYYNMFDVNSSYSKVAYGVRGTNGGSNSLRSTSGGMSIPEGPRGQESARQQFIENVNRLQEESPRFSEQARPVTPTRGSHSAVMGEQNNGGNVRIPSEHSNSSGTGPAKNPSIAPPRGINAVTPSGATPASNESGVKNAGQSNSPARSNNGGAIRISGQQEMNQLNTPSNSSHRSSGGGVNVPSGQGGNSSPTPRGNSGGGMRPR